ncbi:putative fluoride ion transporter CrcB 1 [Actinomadura sp. NBRC 104425]|uniref:fluoride efflux transporter FluC n=1 Tax=Actinomadura sp. NBRC 104425 TaxID=3032204 RepID=UPI0024A5DB4C|nr:CrcB family protein [Actinomadura sp. NBRC 104425]GLZ11854.1 putative fluoride ion transporter CrcB 1 [Actinomadura sp. NBRC 104425]
MPDIRTAARPGPRTDRPPARRRVPWTTLAAISAGGAAGALARHGVTAAFPHAPGGFAWATFAVNTAGCLLIGVLMVAITEIRQAHRLVRPFLGVGVLGGFTTFSTYVVDVQQALQAGAPRTALLDLAATPAAALAAVFTGVHLTRALARASARRRGEAR